MSNAHENPCRLILPSEVPAVVGREINIYFDNVVLVSNIANYHIDVACDKGLQQSERWTFIPESNDTGSHKLKITVYDSDNNQIAEGETNIAVVPAGSGDGSHVTWLMIGDSLTHASVYPDEILKLCGTSENPDLTLLGTHHLDGKLPMNRHEGYGGWTFERFATFYSEVTDPIDYLNKCSPFVFMGDGHPRLDFGRYIAEQCNGIQPDIITFMLGANDIFDADDSNIDENIESVLRYADSLIYDVRESCPKSKTGLAMIIPPGASQDAFGKAYGCGQTRWQYRRNQHKYIERMKAAYGNREAMEIYLIPVYVNIDTVYGYDFCQVMANSCSETAVSRQIDGVHPSESGYKQMADSMYNWMKWLINSR